MANAETITISTFLGADTEVVLRAAAKRAAECVHGNKDKDPATSETMGYYPIFWVYVSAAGKTWEQIREEADARFIKSRTEREATEFLALVKRDGGAAYRMVNEHFSKHLYCKWTNCGTVRSHKWTAAELALTCPEDDEAARRAEFQSQLDASIAYLDFTL